MWSIGSFREELLAGKLQRGIHNGPWASLSSVGPANDYEVVTVSRVRSSSATLTGEFAGRVMEMMLDSGSAVSLVIKQENSNFNQDKLTNIPAPKLRLVTASKEPLPIIGCVQTLVRISQLEVVVVERLVAPVILSIHFLQQHNVILNFSYSPVAINHATHEAK